MDDNNEMFLFITGSLHTYQHVQCSHTVKWVHVYLKCIILAEFISCRYWISKENIVVFQINHDYIYRSQYIIGFPSDEVNSVHN